MKKASYSFTFPAVAIIMATLLSSCLPSTSKSSLRTRAKSGLYDTSNLGAGQGRVLLDNPIILSNNPQFDVTSDFNKILSSPVDITTNSFLQGRPLCYGVSGADYCFQVLSERTSPAPLQTNNGKWGHAVNSEEFHQVNLFYHLTLGFDRFFQNIASGLGQSYDPFSIPLYDTAMPISLINSDGTYNLNPRPISAIANCDSENNASFEKANNLFCFGFTNTTTVPLRWAQDSTVIYHEAGHFFQDLQLNFRNNTILDKPELGSPKGYAESGAIGEGLADYYSYYINGRTHFAEWAAGRYLHASRPMSESDPLHASGISTDRDQRLAYPDFLDYDPNSPGVPYEDIHTAGMIISHYLVALTEDLQTKCSMNKKSAQEQVMLLISETLAELGDLTTKGTYYGVVGKVNMDVTNAALWFDMVNPINYRSFAQTMAKNIYINLGNPLLNRCGGSYYQKDDIESLLDDYGLLIFKTYNQHRNLADGTTKVNTAVTSTNRKKSVLVPKSAIIFDPAEDASIAYVYDDQKLIKEGIAGFKSTGLPINLSQQIGDALPYNNGNSKISPGEVVAIALNIYNNSNSTIGGVQVLANDWDHADTTTGAPCQFSSSMSNDTWPLEMEGGSLDANCSSIAVTSADFAPVCFIQSNESNSTKWVSQPEFREKIALDNNFCLNPSNTAGSDKDCFVRAVRGLDTAYYSKINPKATWGKTFANPTTGEAPGLNWGNLFFLEVSKHLPPGTVIDCRLRVRFSNCEDCYHDSNGANYDYQDVEYNGPRPFKVLHLQFPVTD